MLNLTEIACINMFLGKALKQNFKSVFEEITCITKKCALLFHKLLSIMVYPTAFFSSFVLCFFLFVFMLWFYFNTSISLGKKKQLLLTFTCVVLKMRLLHLSL